MGLTVLTQLEILFVMGSLYQNSAGTFRSLMDTAVGLMCLGHHPTVVGSRDNWVQGPPVEWGNIPTFAFRKIGPFSFHCTPAVGRWLKKRKVRFDAVSFQSVWQYNNYLVTRWCKEQKISYMITAHGNFNATSLGISKWKKRIASRWYVDKMLSEAKCFQALTQAEYRAIRQYGVKQPVCVIPNGISLPQVKNDSIEDTAMSPIVDDRKVCLYLGRFHKIKNLISLVQAWARLDHFRKDWVLLLVGAVKGDYRQVLDDEVGRLGLKGDVLCLGSKYGKEKAVCFSRASFLVLPSLSEGFPVSLLEAMSYGLPVLYTDACNFPEIAAAGAGIEIGISVMHLEEGLEKMMRKSDSERTAMGTRGYDLVKEKYQWEEIINELVSVYLWMSDKAPAPRSVIFD